MFSAIMSENEVSYKACEVLVLADIAYRCVANPKASRELLAHGDVLRRAWRAEVGLSFSCSEKLPQQLILRRAIRRHRGNGEGSLPYQHGSRNRRTLHRRLVPRQGAGRCGQLGR
jgi:hypothetical protein